ncbi:hypothetical protein BH23PAT2_BH23PAT2_08200 [soil metagenome]
MPSSEEQQKKNAEAIKAIKNTPNDELPVMPETVRNGDTLQWFYRSVIDNFTCLNGRKSPLYLRRSEHGLAIRIGQVWRVYRRSEQIEFWRDAMAAYRELAESNWSTKRARDLWDYFQVYAPQIEFDNRRYFEMGNCILDGLTGELNKEDDRFLKNPTTRASLLDYKQDYAPSVAWNKWYETMDEYQQKVRDWSVGSAIVGNHGLLFTFGQSRTGKSTLAEGLAEVLGSGAGVFSLSRNWGRFYTQHMDNTTYLYDADAKGAKNQNNENYGTLHLMASGDPIQVEVKGSEIYQTTNYGFIEVISNSPTTLSFEQSLVDRVRFCLYTYINPRADGGEMKRMILADKQAWLNYAVGCAIKLARGEVQRPAIDKYQMYGWVLWLQEANSYGKMCVEEGRVLTYQEYKFAYEGASRFTLTKETTEEMRAGFGELSRQFGENFLAYDWEAYGEQLKKDYYNEEAPKLF